MTVLAIDCSGPVCAAAIADESGQTILAQYSEDIGRGHAERLPAIAENVLDEAGMTLPDLTRISVTIGPGSFAGIRVGVSFARGLALALGVPAVGVSTLAAIGVPLAQANNARILVLLDARRRGLFAAGYGPDGTAWLDPVELTVKQAADTAATGNFLLAGSGADLLVEELPFLGGRVVRRDQTPSIAVVAAMGAQLDPATALPEPQYLREADAKPQTGFALPRTLEPADGRQPL